MNFNRAILALSLAVTVGIFAEEAPAISEAPVKYRLKSPVGEVKAGTEIEIVSVTDQLGLRILVDGKPVGAGEISFEDFVASLELFGETKKSAKIFYKLADYCMKGRVDLAEKYAGRALQLDSDFHGDAKKRLAELTNPALLYRKQLFASPYFDSPEEPKSGPRAHLLELAKHPPANHVELRKAYLDLQEGRVFGTAKLPPPPERKALTAFEWAVVLGDELGPEHPLEKLSDADAAELKAWFTASPTFREHFLLALEPGFDFYQNAARIALKLKAAYPKDVANFEALLLAFATTWDDPAALKPQDVGIPELRDTPAPTCKVEEAFGWYVKNQAKLCPWFRQTPWRLLAYVAADTAVLSERDWVLQNYPFNPAVGKSYADVKYDNSKLKDNVGKLGGHPYTLADLKTFGGVCRDQAFFARSICRYLGMPAYWASGYGRTGGVGHAWVGWVIPAPTGGFQLSDYGRYVEDKFYTALVTHPRTGEKMFDYILSLETKGLSNEKTFNEADLLYHVFEEVGDFVDPKLRYEILIEAVRGNAFHRRAWLALADGTAAGHLPQATAGPQWEYLTSQFKDTPDFTVEVLAKFARMFSDVESGYKLYETTAKMYFAMKREDLAARLRLDQVELCVTAGKTDIAFSTALKGMQECAGTGKEGAALADKAVAMAKDAAQKKQVVDALKATLTRTPKMRADEPNDYWIELATLLRDTMRGLGDEAGAAKLDTDIKALSKH